MPYEVVVQPVAEAELEACAIATSGRTRRSGPRVGGGRSSQRRKVSVAGRRAVRSRRRTAPSATKCASSSWAPTASSSPSTRVPAAYTSSTCTTALDDLWVKPSPENETPRHSDDAQRHRAVLIHPADTQAELPPSGLSHGPSRCVRRLRTRRHGDWALPRPCQIVQPCMVLEVRLHPVPVKKSVMPSAA